MSQMALRAKADGPARPVNEGFETFKTIALTLLFVLVLRVLVFQPFTIPSASMQPNLYEGDYIFVTKWSYGYSRHSIPFSPPVLNGRILERAPQRGDVAVFKTPRDNRTDLIKRVIGLPGDRVEVRDGLLYLNGVQVKRERLDAAGDAVRYRETLPGGRSFVTEDLGRDRELDNTAVFVVPEGHYFVMGDNRDNSWDGRVPPELGGVGYLPAENLVGRARMVLFAWNPGSSLWKPWTWLNINTSRFLKPLN
jgi:signal peptidase I